MSYRCQLCNAPVKPGQQARKHVVYKIVDDPPRKDIAREYAVCASCDVLLDAGMSPADIIRRHARASAIPLPPPGTGSIGRPARLKQ